MFRDLEAWAGATGALDGGDIVAVDQQPYNGEATVRALPGLGIGSWTFANLRVNRSRELRDGCDDLLMVIATSGDRLVSHRGREQTLGADDAVLMTTAETATKTYPSLSRLISVCECRARIQKSGGQRPSKAPHSRASIAPSLETSDPTEETNMSRQDDNKAIVGRWFTEFWGKSCNLGIVDELAAPDMLLQYSLHEPRKGREDIKAFMTDFRKAFPDLNFWGTADLIAEGDYVVGRWEGGGTHTGAAFSDFRAGSLPANTGRKMRFTGTTVLKLKDGKIVEEIGLDDGVTALQQLGLIRLAA